MSGIKQPTVEDIKAIVEEGIDDEIENFSMDANWYEDYGMDSLGAVAVVVATQKKFGVRLSDEKMPDIRTGNDLVKTINELRAEAPAAA